ncbi:MAG: DUF5906 domain-containing protein [Vicinamibacterales bacterium]
MRPLSLAEFEQSDPVTTERDYEGGRVLTAINIYRPSELVMRPAPSPQQAKRLVAPWREMARQMFGKDRKHLLQWMRHTVQRPDEKANHHPWLIGAEGSSKDTFLKPLAAAVGEHNIRAIQGKVLGSGFTEWVERAKLLMVRDIAKLDEDDWNAAKSLFTHPPDQLLVNEKHRSARWVPNLVHLIVMTNNLDALPATVDGRRLLVLQALAPTHDPEDPSQPYDPDKTNRYLEREDVQAAIAHYLRTEPVDAVAMRGDAPATAAKQLVIESTESELAHRIRELRDNGDGPFAGELFQVDTVVERLRREPAHERDLTAQRVSAELRKGKFAVSLHKQARSPKGRKVRLWTTGDARAYERLTDAGLWEAYQQQVRTAKGAK